MHILYEKDIIADVEANFLIRAKDIFVGDKLLKLRLRYPLSKGDIE